MQSVRGISFIGDGVVSVDSKGLNSWSIQNDDDLHLSHTARLHDLNILFMGQGTNSNIIVVSTDGEMKVFSIVDPAEGSLELIATSDADRAVCGAVMLSQGQEIATVDGSDTIRIFTISDGRFVPSDGRFMPSDGRFMPSAVGRFIELGDATADLL